MALRLISVSKRYGNQQVLDGVTLHVRPGDCYGFLGHNGAGKSTAMRVALGLIRADAGRVLVDGFDAAEHPLEARARMGGLIEVPGFHAGLSGRTNLVLLARLQGLHRREAAVESDRVLEAVGLTHAAAKASGAYSHGMRQRLGIAQALLGRPKVVLLDEPTSGLDPEGMEEIRRLLRRITKDEGATVLLSSHQLHEISGVCNRVGILRRGRLLVENETARLLRSHADRHVVRTGDDARAATVLAGLGLAPRMSADVAGGGAGIEVDIADRAPSVVARTLVEAGIELRAFGPRETSLEEIYLHFTRHGEAAVAPDAAPSPGAGEPSPRIAPPGPIRRTAAYDVRRWLSSAAVPLSFLAPGVVGALAITADRLGTASATSEVASGHVATATHVTAFTEAARGLSHGLPLLALAVAATAALAIAGEFGRGTLRNLLLRPVGRSRAVLGKTLASVGAALAGYAVLVGAVMGAAALFSDFEDLVEILPGGQRYVFEGFAATDLWPELGRCVASIAPGLVAFAAIGVLVGALAKSGAGAIVGVFSTTLVLVGAPAFIGRAAAAWLPSSYLPWVITDTSPARRLYDLSTGVSNATASDARAVWVPLAWAATAVAAACWRMRRRAVP